MATNTFRQVIVTTSSTRQRVMGILYLILALILLLYFARETTPDSVTAFGLNATGKSAVQFAPWRIPSQATIYGLAIASALLGGIQIARGFGRYTNLVLTLVVGFFVFSSLVWAAADKSMNLAGLFYNTLSSAVPLTLAAFSGLLCERAGVVNIAIEGMMLGGAFTSAFVGSVTHSLWIALFGALLSGVLFGAIHGVFSIKYKVNQIVSGTVINIFATGLTSYLSTKFLQVYQQLNDPGIFPPLDIPGLIHIPFIGEIVFDNNIYVYIMFILLVVLQLAYFRTRWGLRMRSVGEHPKAADTLGINVIRTRYIAVLLSGAMAGFAGSAFTIGGVGRFDNLMTAGRGFIGLAALIFGSYTPIGTFGAGLLFGFADSVSSKLAIVGVDIPSQILLMVPYIATMIVLGGVVGRSQMPAADGIPYEKEGG
jgi:ABC-type uncharacterized transport system permease subunit